MVRLLASLALLLLLTLVLAALLLLLLLLLLPVPVLPQLRQQQRRAVAAAATLCPGGPPNPPYGSTFRPPLASSVYPPLLFCAVSKLLELCSGDLVSLPSPPLFFRPGTAAELLKFCGNMEAAVIKTVEQGHFTKDLAICVHGTTKVRGRGMRLVWCVLHLPLCDAMVWSGGPAQIVCAWNHCKRGRSKL